MDSGLPISLRAYRAVTRAASPLARVLIHQRLKHGKEDRERVPERRGMTNLTRPSGPLVWVHGASVGEVMATAALIEHLRSMNIRVLVTSGTLASAEIVAKRFPPDVIHQFLPYDSPRFVARFLDHWRPNLALFVESDLWPNMIVGGAQRRIPMILINARMSPRSFPRWRLAPRSIAALLGRLELCLAQSQADAERFSALGCEHAVATGNLKFDVPAPPADPKALDHLMTMTQGRPIIVGASTHPGEDEILVDVHKMLVGRFPRLLSIIVPRHPQRGEGLARMIAATGSRVALRSQQQMPNSQVEIYVADSVGELGLFYRLAPVVVMGGSFAPIGGHNPIEPIELGAAIVHGPHTHNWPELYSELGAAGGAIEASDPAAIAAVCGNWLADGAARDRVLKQGHVVVDAFGGALDRTLKALEPYVLQLSLEGRASNA